MVLSPLIGATFSSDLAFKSAITDVLDVDLATQLESNLVSAAIQMNDTNILISILG
jgi:SP family arabinose:H+ symporter-like MFS transporter